MRVDCYRACDVGWDKIIDEMIEKLIATGEDFEITDIKEKYGTLRVYLSPDFEKFDLIVQEACEKSRYTCEMCGKPGQLGVENGNKYGYWKTLCKECGPNHCLPSEKD